MYPWAGKNWFQPYDTILKQMFQFLLFILLEEEFDKTFGEKSGAYLGISLLGLLSTWES